MRKNRGFWHAHGRTAPERGRRTSWATFIKAHLGVLVGMDFFTVEVVTWLGLIRYHVLFAIDIASRKVEILRIAVNPGGLWMEQMARNLVDALDGQGHQDRVTSFAQPASVASLRLIMIDRSD
jgi:hypothetical protein